MFIIPFQPIALVYTVRKYHKYQYYRKMQSTSTETFEINQVNIIKQVFDTSHFILATYDFLNN